MTSGHALDLPEGSCDCHVHVVGAAARYPMVGDRHYTPAPAPHESLLAHLQRNGFQRTVIVQPSFYGHDNSCMLDSLARLDGAGRGIAVVEESVDDTELVRLNAAGVRGLRVNVESAGLRDTRAAERPLRQWAERIAPLGWHLQLYAHHATIVQLASLLSELAVPVVLDHFAMLPASTSIDDPAVRRIVDLMRNGSAYIKLSAPYRVAAEPWVDTALHLARALVQSNPRRVLWGSDWPHTNREPGRAAHEVSIYRQVSPVTLGESVLRWLPSTELRQQVLVDNPASLYGF